MMADRNGARKTKRVKIERPDKSGAVTMRKIRNLIWAEARKRPECMLGEGHRERPNVREIVRQMRKKGASVNATTFQRIMQLDRHSDPDEESDYTPSAAVKASLMLWLRIPTEVKLLQAWDAAPSAPALHPLERRADARK